MMMYRVADPATLATRAADPGPDVVSRLFRMMALPTAEIPPDIARLVDGPSRELTGQCSPHNLVLPWNALARDLTTSTASGTQKAGFLATDTPANPVQESLRPFSVVAAAGATVLEMAGTATRRLPIVSTAPVAEWVAEQGAPQTADGGMNFTSTTIAARELACSVKVSRRLSKQAETPGVEALVRNELMAAIGRALDKAVLAGDGNLQPLGIVGTAGVISQSGSTLGRTGVVTMLNSIAATGIRRDRVTYILPPATATVLQGRETGTGTGRYVLEDDGTIAGRPALVTPEAPSATVIAGDFAGCLVGTWGGIWMQANPYRFSSAGDIQIDVRLIVGVAFPRPATFAVATSVN